MYGVKLLNASSVYHENWSWQKEKENGNWKPKWTTSIAVTAADVKSLTVSVTANVIGRAFHARDFVLADVKSIGHMKTP